MVGNLKNVFSGMWYMDHNYSNSYVPYLFSILSGHKLDYQLEKVTTDFIQFGSITDYNHHSNGTLSRISINDNQYVGVIKLHSAMTKNDVFCGQKGTSTIAAQVEKWQLDANCIGLVQDIDSGGGESSGTRKLARSIKYTFTKPSSTFNRGVMGSAAVFTGCSSDKVYMDIDADYSGSIGAMGSFTDIRPALEKLGVKFHVFNADGSEEKNAEHLEMLKGNYKPVKEQFLNKSKDQFIDWMKDVRPGIKKTALKGKMFDVQDSIKEGIVDEVGSFTDAFNYVVQQHEDSLKSNNNNLITNKSMAKSEKAYPSLQAAMGIEKPITIKNGFWDGGGKAEFTEAQLDSLESKLSENAEPTKELTAQVATLKAKETTLTSLDSSVAKAMVDLGLEASGDTQADFNSIVEKTIEYGSQDGAKHTNSSRNEDETEEETPEYVNLNAEHYQNLGQ